jgi:hypothetical protein
MELEVQHILEVCLRSGLVGDCAFWSLRVLLWSAVVEFDVGFGNVLFPGDAPHS